VVMRPSRAAQALMSSRRMAKTCCGVRGDMDPE
jgi:hypothetical protein